MSTGPGSSPPLSRRQFLRALGLGAAGIALTPVSSALWKARRRRVTRRWSDPRAWGGMVPGRGSVAVVRGRVLLDRNVRVAGVVVEPGGELVFERGRDRTLRTTGNVVVRGKLTMRPSGPRIRHRLVFTRVDERRYVGGGMDPKASDVGLWVAGNGVLNLQGSPKLAWTRAARGVETGATEIQLQQDPIGWRVGDLIVLTPTASPDVEDHHLAYDTASVRAISGRTVTLSSPTGFSHPTVAVAPGTELGPEVLNLSRNVRIEGTPGGRAHVLIRSSRPQRIRHVAIRHMGPRQPTGKDRKGVPITEGVVGRYGLHFHHCGDGSRGSVVEGVAVRDCGSHAFVPHMSHGVRFQDCISHDTREDAFWWDPPDSKDHESFSNDVLYEGCVASLVRTDPPGHRGHRLTGFNHRAGTGNTARGCVAVGVEGGKDASGFHWPEKGQGVWTFADCIAHNNSGHGIFVWQNTSARNEVERYVGYHNGGAGISQGAYRNRYHYSDSILYGNGMAAILLHALSKGDGPPLRFERVRCDGGGLTDHVVLTTKHNTRAVDPTRFENCLFLGYRGSALHVRDAGNDVPDLIDLVDCGFAGNHLWLGDNVHGESLVRVGGLEARRKDQVGIYNPAWNASVRPGTP